MKLQFAEGFQGDSWVGAIGMERFEFERAEAPFEVAAPYDEALLRMTWRKRSEVPVEGQEKLQVVYSDEPVFALFEELPLAEGAGEAVLTTDPASEIPGTVESVEEVADGDQLTGWAEPPLPPVRRKLKPKPVSKPQA